MVVKWVLATMAFSFLSSCWRYFHSGDCVHEEELPCEEEEEEEETCWFLGRVLLFYCLAVALLMMFHHALEWMHENRKGCWTKRSTGKKDASRKDSRIEDTDSSRPCCCRLGICGVLRKLFGEKETALADSPSSSVSLKRRLSKRLSRLSQQTFCDSASSNSGSLASQPTSWRASQTEEESLSIVSLKEVKASQAARAPGSHWTREQPCLRCKAKRTKEWLAQHFFAEDLPPQES